MEKTTLLTADGNVRAFHYLADKDKVIDKTLIWSIEFSDTLEVLFYTFIDWKPNVAGNGWETYSGVYKWNVASFNVLAATSTIINTAALTTAIIAASLF